MHIHLYIISSHWRSRCDFFQWGVEIFQSKFEFENWRQRVRKIEKKLKSSFDSEKMMIRKRRKFMLCKRKILFKDFDRNSNSNEFHSVEKSADHLSCDLLRVANRVANRAKNECASMKCFSRKLIFLCRCDRTSLDYFETKMCSMMCEENENVFEMQMKNENVFAIKKFEIFQSVVFSEIKNLLHLCLKKLFALFFFSCVPFEVSESAVFIFSSQNCFDLAILHFFNFEFESVCSNNSSICVSEICVSFFFSMIFFLLTMFSIFLSSSILL